MSLSKAKKLVLVEIIQGTNLTEVEIDISKFKSCDLADVDKTSLVNGLCTKKPALSDYFKHKDTSFKVESECFPGRFVEIGDQSPISSKIVRCVIPQTIRQPFKDLTATTNETPDRGCTGSILRSAMDDLENSQVFAIGETTLLNNLSISRALAISTPNAGCANDPLRCEDIQCINDPSHYQQPSATTVWSDNRARITRSGVFEQPRMASERVIHEHSSAEGASTPGTAIEPMQQEIYALQQNKRIEAANHHHAVRRDFNIELFQPPTWFGEEINQKLSTGLRLTVPQESKLCREYARSMRKQTLAPTPNANRLVVDVMYTKHKLDYLNDESATKKFWSEKLSNCLSRMRREDGQPINRGGRPRKEKGASYVPTSINTGGITQAQRDEYPLHLKRLQELWIQSPLSDGINILFKVTFPIRRYLITSGELPEEMTVSRFIKEHAPNLVNPHFLFQELDAVLGNNTSANFISLWGEIVQKILSIAENKKKNKKIKDILMSSEDSESCRALQVIPLLIGSNRGKDSDLFFFQLIDESENLLEAIGTPNRTTPFIVQCGKTFHVVVDKEPTWLFNDDPASAFLALLAAYYVFHINYSEKVLPTLTFAQTYLLKKPDSNSRNCARVRNFLSLLVTAGAPEPVS